MYYPIGTLVLLKEGTVKVLIIGYKVKEANSDKVYDYLGCAYPIGVLKSDQNLLFDKEKIDKVIHLGYKDEEFDLIEEQLKIIDELENK